MDTETIVNARVFDNVYVCRYCKSKMRIGNPNLIKEGKVRCRKCHRIAFRPKSKEIRETKAATTTSAPANKSK
ncbi:MAG: hypothetical protein QXX36_01845 [Candidatus Rehaiarchaeum fermentans]|nr:hypothetical protein [Candidatus Rehaiarchaeum fermentans]MCW1297327.1 hypothetical protein [Candidatus Rehaiarchaeum fermentans]MCW1302348.1 hypothetical protein [Candidatus Rehaiarchaeum fermentans]